MQLDSPRACFQDLRALGREPNLAGVSGTWQFELEGEGTWSVQVEDGNLSVHEGATDQPTARLRLRGPDFVRLCRGEHNENTTTCFLRGVVKLDGDVRFASRLQSIFPLNDAHAERKAP